MGKENKEGKREIANRTGSVEKKKRQDEQGNKGEKGKK